MSNEPKLQSKPAKGGLTTKHIVLIIAFLLIVCATVLTAIYLLRPKQDTLAEISATPIVTEENVKEIEREIEDKVAQGMFETHMNTTWTFPDGKSPSSDAVMGNAPSNNYPFYFTVTIPDEQEPVFTSGILPIGTEIAEIKLDKELTAGTYYAVIGIHMIDDEGELIEGNMGINVTLVIES